MKKIGFTLAEVLITLSIIGVVAALTLPSLNTAVQKHRVGPTLRKFVNTIENANDRMMADKDAELLSDITTANNEDTSDAALDYLNNLKNYVKGNVKSVENEISVTSMNGIAENVNKNLFALMTLESGEEVLFRRRARTEAAAPYKGRYGFVFYDLNGYSTPPNKLCKDIFAFVLDETGTLFPRGSSTYNQVYSGDNSEETKAKGYYCAGEIADNNWEVKYKY